ncbi:hypothetical protein [Actinacidiphila glaucinigra]|uniref:hypothetical protein n=1 Tax=Actinacidiphila glaucinigra TaxID=235986 RepID=UPI0036E2632A
MPEHSDVRFGAVRQQVGQERRAGGGGGRDVMAAEPALPVRQPGARIAPLASTNSAMVRPMGPHHG